NEVINFCATVAISDAAGRSGMLAWGYPDALSNVIKDGTLLTNAKEARLCRFASQISLTPANVAPCRRDIPSGSGNLQPF
ncbi:hypothetical protein JTL58_34640, partial [Pseudomonas aeruginosa]|nr:hypothetical protein [Pseudomonas aeruginosa]